MDATRVLRWYHTRCYISMRGEHLLTTSINLDFYFRSQRTNRNQVYPDTDQTLGKIYETTFQTLKTINIELWFLREREQKR